MVQWQTSTILTLLVGVSAAHQWPYDRYRGTINKNGVPVPLKSYPEFETEEPRNGFGQFLHRIVDRKNIGGLQDLFIDGSVPAHAGFDELRKALKLPDTHSGKKRPDDEATALFGHLPFELDSGCLADKAKWWYRSYDGSCNWIKKGEISEGSYGAAKSRDYGQHSYADGISKPREGPNARAVSNAFFKRKKTLYFKHTPFLLGFIEFLIHDITWSPDSATEFVDVPMPGDESYFPLSTTLRVWRTEAVPGTGTSRDNPREIINRASTWIDLSSLYGSTQDVATRLRTFERGKLKTQELKTRGAKKAASYLPFNTMNVATNGPGDVTTLFAGGDPRTNEDWVMLGFHTLILREHNRMCDILAEKKPEYNDEELYQTVRLLMGAKFSLIGNAYQMSYFQNMTWPMDDGFPLYREMLGKDWLEINPANNYPWPVVTPHGLPTTVSAEMVIVYRFHEFIIKSFPIKDASNETLWEQRLVDTLFNATGFIDAGLENVLRGMLATFIPNFKSGVEEDFRSAGKGTPRPFDLATWSIVHEREQGLPTFNNYFRAYNQGGELGKPKVQVPIRQKFEDFSSDSEMVLELKRLYKTPDDVDLVVGCQLDETLFPHATIPTSSAIISLFSLISMGNSDRFSVGFAAMRCLLVDKPWDCHPSNALEELMWKPMPTKLFPNFRFYDNFWMTELDFQAHGRNLLWRIVTENSELKCLQRDPLFPVDEETNPILCSLPEAGIDIKLLLSTGVEVILSLIKMNYGKIATTLLALGVGALIFGKFTKASRG